MKKKSSYKMQPTVSGTLDGHDYVDLGLPSGTKWATYNVGASMPTEYGDYFAWGETTPKENYDLTTYKWCKGIANTMTKYCVGRDYGTVDKQTILLAEDDAATANWGDNWRMPTISELEELHFGCAWELTHDFNGSGIAGLVGTSNANGNTIFLPAAGSRRGTDLNDVGYYGLCSSSSLNEDHSCNVYGLYFCCFFFGRVENGRDCGCSVRAVVK